MEGVECAWGEDVYDIHTSSLSPLLPYTQTIAEKKKAKKKAAIPQGGKQRTITTVLLEAFYLGSSLKKAVSKS